jgi:hypothetical protein
MTDISIHERPISASLVPEAERLLFLPKTFPVVFMRVEHGVYDWMRRLCRAYDGGSWDFLTTSNGSGFLVPRMTGPVRVQVEGNGFDELMSTHAAGLVATIFSINHLMFCTLPDEIVDLLLMRYDALLAYGAEHEELRLIYAAID